MYLQLKRFRIDFLTETEHNSVFVLLRNKRIVQFSVPNEILKLRKFNNNDLLLQQNVRYEKKSKLHKLLILLTDKILN